MTDELQREVDRLDFDCDLTQQLERIPKPLLDVLVMLRDDELSMLYLSIRMHMRCQPGAQPALRIGGPEENFSMELASSLRLTLRRLLWVHRLIRGGFLTAEIPRTLEAATKSTFLEELFAAIEHKRRRENMASETNVETTGLRYNFEDRSGAAFRLTEDEIEAKVDLHRNVLEFALGPGAVRARILLTLWPQDQDALRTLREFEAICSLG